jgi:hypothetical protein
MIQLPFYIQQAADLGLLEVQDGKVVSCRKDEVETVMGITRIIEKIQPTTVARIDSTKDQEAIVLCRVLSSPSGKARELWSELRVAFGIGHGQSVPDNLWSSPELRAIGSEIDRTFLGERNAAIIGRESLISQYEALSQASRTVGFQEFAKAVSELSSPETMNSYGDAKSEWDTALDLLRQARVRALYKETLYMAEQVGRSDSKLEKNIEFLQARAMECLGMLRGSIGKQGDAVDIVEDLFGSEGEGGFLDKLMSARAMEQPVSTGIDALDLDMEGGINRPSNVASGGRMFALAARTGVGKTQLAVHVAASAVTGGLTVGFISAELDKPAIYSRLWSSITKKTNATAVFSGKIAAPHQDEKEDVAAALMQAGNVVQERGGKLLVEAPWGADVDTVVNSMRSMKAKNPQLRLVILDHFHCLSRHKGSSSNEASMMEERAYRLMTAAKELDIDLIVLAQMNRVGMDVVSRKQPPQLNEIRGTDALAHVCHAVWIVRREPQEDGADPNTPRNLELWHVKTRGRQAYWNHQTKRVEGFKGFVEKSILMVDHATSSIAFDDTKTQVRS